jgi:serine/threonine-protein kinase
LEEDLATGREKVAARAREGLKYEKTFSDASNVLMAHLKGKPECRELMNELVASSGDHDTSQQAAPATSRAVEA